MVIVEKSFPRGGTSANEAKTDENKDNIIFGALQKKIKKSKPNKAKDDLETLLEDETKQDNIETVSAELLNYDSIQDGMNIMGMVKAVDQLYLSISLPGRMTARVSALEVSESYTKATKEFLQNVDQKEQNYKSLKELYNIGQIVYGRVQDVVKHEHGRTDINMSLKPAQVHSEIQHANVKKSFIFNGAIEEVQEHGYIIESGIKGMRTFLPMEKSQQPLHAVGELVYLKVEKITQDKAASTCICKEMKVENLKIKNQSSPNIEYIVPSAIVQFDVTKQLKDGLQGTIMNESFTAYINEHQLSESLALPEDYELKATLNARVLYVMPLTKLVYLSLNLHNKEDGELAGSSSTAVAPAFKRGDVIENAKVHRLGTGGVILVLKNKFKGIISYKTIKTNYKGNYDQDELLTKYAKKTQHKVRVLSYDQMDSMFICTDDANVVNEKVFGLEDLQAGEFVTVTVKERDPKVGGYAVQVGKIKGIIEKLFLAPSTKPLEEKSKIRCRVIAVNQERKTVYFTNRPEYLAKSCQVLTSLNNARANAVYTGTIVACNDDYMLIKFFNHLKGVLHKDRLNGLMAAEMANYYVGQTMSFRILRKDEEQITLSLPEDTFNMGEICPVTVVHTLESGLEIKIAYDIADDQEEAVADAKGLIPLRLLSDFTDLVQAKLRIFPENTETKAVCIVKNIFSLRDVDYFQQHLTNDWRSVQPGDILKAYVKNVAEDVVELMLPIRDYGKLVKVHLKMLLVNAFKNPNIMLSPEQPVYVKVLGKEQTTKTITISAKLTDVWDGQLSGTAHDIERYLSEVRDIKKAFKKQGNSIAKYSIGDKVTAQFQGIDSLTKDWQYELDNSKVPAIVKASLLGKAKAPKVGDKQECVILWIDYSQELIFISNQSGDLERITATGQIPPNLVGKSGINAKIILKLENVFICSLKKGKNPLVYCPVRLHFNDFENSASIDVKEGEFCKLAFIHETKPIAVLESTYKLWQDIRSKRKAQQDMEASKRKKAKLVKEEAAAEDTTKEEETKSEKKLKRKLVEKAVTVTPEVVSKKIKEKPKKSESAPKPDVLFYEDKTSVQQEGNKIVKANTKRQQASNVSQKTEVKTLPGIDNFWSTDLTQLNQANGDGAASSDEDENNDSLSATPKKKLTAAEKFKEQREEESRLRTIEEKYSDPNQLPESVDQFDRLILSDPNNSKNWINYMVYHLQSTEIDKAKAVARRAIKAISFRNSDDQLNIWIALLNLELRYGSKETFDETLKEALTLNDPLKTYLRTVEILSDAKRERELIEVIGIITKKFKAQQEVWKAAANAYFSIDMAERAQQMLHKALACLPEREHVNTIVVFANLNHKHNHNEMAQTLLDQVVTSYPKRVDVWTQYVDLLVKENLTDSARNVLERAVIQKIPLKKMRTIFKKYLEFEERFGSDDDVQKVKKLATEYVKNNANL